MPAAPDRRRKILVDTALVLLGTTVGLVVAELLVRVVGYEGDHEREAVAFHHVYGAIPDDAWVFTESIERGELEVYGVRYAVERADTTRVVFVGDSGTQGAIDLELDYPRRFAALARDAGIAPDVINLGVPGMCTADELEVLRRFVVDLDPDFVVLGVFLANDIQFNLAAMREIGRSPALGWLRHHSALVHFGYLRWLASGPTELRDEHGIDVLTYDGGEYLTYFDPAPPIIAEAYDATADSLQRVRDLARDEGWTLAITLIPTRTTTSERVDFVDPPVTEAWSSFTLEPGERLDFERPTRVIVEQCRNLDLLCVDNTARFRELGTEAAFVAGDDHPSAAGHEALARGVYEALAGLLARADRVPAGVQAR
jgi:hypothetical protein